MKRFYVLFFSLILVCGLFAGCKKSESTDESAQDNSEKSITLINVKSEVNSQIEELAAAYTAETGVKVTVLSVQAGVDASATIKGYYLSDQMPDIIACEAAGFGN